jgi:hypothetical protein
MRYNEASQGKTVVIIVIGMHAYVVSDDEPILRLLNLQLQRQRCM